MSVTERRIHSISSHLTSEKVKNDTSIIMDTERNKKTFNVEHMTKILYGGHQDIWQSFFDSLGKESIFTQSIDDLNHAEIRELTMARIRRLVEMDCFQGLDVRSLGILGKVIYMIDPSTSIRIGVHSGLFMGSIAGNGTQYHKKKYYKPGLKGKVFGCFGMTELGHGSNAAGLETTATFDLKTQEFVINTPNLTATKWWIGGAAETATHCCVFARLIIKERDLGVHTFVVPLRDPKTHEPLPGVTIGDCGIKLGMNGIDNGYLQFNNVRIPREDMLDQYARVNEDGSYWKAGKSSLALQRVALIGARCGIVGQSAVEGMKALSIAIRYSSIRCQFETGPGKPERAILDYQTQMNRLFIPLAEIISIQFASLSLEESYQNLLQDLLTGNTSNLSDVHATAAGMKAFCSWTTRDALTICRDCLGGHGFSAYNGISRAMRDFQVQTTWDGDNTVLSQQTARYLVQCIKKAMEGKKLKGSVKYLENANDILSSNWQVNSEEDLLDPKIQVEAFRWRTTSLCAQAATRIQQDVANGIDPANAWNNSLVDLLALAKSHCDLYKLDTFINALEHHKKTEDPQLISVLKALCDLYALSNIEKDLGIFRNNEFVSSEQAIMVKEKVRKLFLVIRPNAVSIIDSFAIPDWVLASPVGQKDGNIYETYFERVQQAHSNPVPSYWEKHIKPLTNPSN